MSLDANFKKNKDFKSDYEYALFFLYSYRGSEATFNSYRREIERLLHWSVICKKSVKEFKREDIEQFIEFCKSPPKEWIGLKNVSRFITKNGRRIPNLNWRPFVATVTKFAHSNGVQPSANGYALSQEAVKAIFAVLGSFYNYLMQENYIGYNPISQIRQKSKFIRKIQTKTVIRRLTNLQWDYVIETAEKMAEENPKIHERTLFIINALFAMYLRISELAASKRWTPEMGDFFTDSDGAWWFKTVGKGNKERNIVVSDAMLKALKRYRLYLGLSSLPSPSENTPLIQRERGKGSIKSTRRIRSIVQNCFDQAIYEMQKDGFSEESQQLKSATVHWLRHTGISEDVKYRPREHVRDDAGHSSSSITDKYIDSQLRERHRSGKKKPIH